MTVSWAPPQSREPVARSSAAAADETNTGLSDDKEDDDEVAGCDWSIKEGSEDKDETASDELCFIVLGFVYDYSFLCLTFGVLSIKMIFNENTETTRRKAMEG